MTREDAIAAVLLSSFDAAKLSLTTAKWMNFEDWWLGNFCAGAQRKPHPAPVRGACPVPSANAGQSCLGNGVAGAQAHSHRVDEH